MKLQLSLIERWFSLTKKLIKREDYRLITPYWCNRLLLVNGKSQSVKWWVENYFEIDGKLCDINEIIENIKLFCTFKPFTTNIMTLGYPKSTDTERILKLEHKGIEIRTGRTEWGAEKDRLYFVILHGNIIDEK